MAETASKRSAPTNYYHTNDTHHVKPLLPPLHLVCRGGCRYVHLLGTNYRNPGMTFYRCDLGRLFKQISEISRLGRPATTHPPVLPSPIPSRSPKVLQSVHGYLFECVFRLGLERILKDDGRTNNTITQSEINRRSTK